MKKTLLFIIVLMLILSGCSVVEVSQNSDTTGEKAPSVVTDFADTEIADTTASDTTAEPENTLHESENGTYPAVLMYHLILDEPYTDLTNLFVPPSDFADHLKSLKEAGYTFLFASEFGKYEEKTVIITLDDGYEDNCTNLLPLLEEYDAKATVFMIADKIDKPRYMSSDMLKKIADSGHVEIGSHTVYHNDLSYLDEDGIRRELSDSQRILREKTGQEIRAVAYPAGGFNDTVSSIAAEYYDVAFTTKYGYFEDGGNRLEIPRFAVYRGVMGEGLLWTIGD